MTKEKVSLSKPWQDFSKWEKKLSADVDSPMYEKYRKEIQENNYLVLEVFQQYLKEKLGLSDVVVRRHDENIDFFLNEGALYYGLHTPDKAIYEISDFLGDFFPRKAMWASRASLKQNGASLKRFYNFLYEMDEINENQLKFVKTSVISGIQSGLEHIEWQEELLEEWD
ncbi:hypothetical protein ACFO26_01680 [Lactococcus nasutitermitis]|uniref:Uncharacterized protein n=1 Tax=Lactococcus nasutitermitis TaxID=1652957 RepID=A0ABV9JDQ7_9LACT|nr:hypothetical protein [Lactococcus nasutitermitis]